MGANIFNAIKHALTQRLLAQRPCVWGKLPSHGDYVRYRCSPQQAWMWQAWTDQVWHMPERHAPEQGQGISLEIPATQIDLGTVPVAFLMPPGMLNFSPSHHVHGVMVASQDNVGRACPLIIYQQVSSAWLESCWRVAVGKSGAPNGQHLLYWFARIAARFQASDKSFNDLCAAVDLIWQQHQPGWSQLWGEQDAAPDTAELRQAVLQYGAYDSLDAAQGFSGVRHLPWKNWPLTALKKQPPSACFWQQDLHGGYLNASESLLGLWGER